MKNISLKIIILLLLGKSLHAQDKTAFGLSAIYNFPLQTVGAGFRIQMPVANRFALVPQIKYMPSFNNIHEAYGGINLHYFLINNTFSLGTRRVVNPKRPVIYLAAGVEYNRWINFKRTAQSEAKQNNVLPEAGLGLSGGWNFIRIFAEGKYNILWNESYGEVGVLFFPFNNRLQRKNNCPKP
ncbi:hypothetical protein [Emticicia sp. BO119]|uniref:hypothetical protein n=1 Tax=Emticicia sp. BO119 TaxID=2757768 RepID=UPI0015F0007B|nr:hypothetical protein [Emticicia sp. BO119]MBA4849790.1 hypothetical protein [Emticicia sp. BO119]